MNDIVLNGETLEISRVLDSIEIEGFDHTFADGKAESKLVVAPGGSPGPGGNGINIRLISDDEYYNSHIQVPKPNVNYIFSGIIS